MFRAFRYLAIFSIAVLLWGCHSAEYYREQRVEKARKHFDTISKKVIEKGALFTLPLCIQVALRQNLDLKVYELKERITQEKVTAEMLGMLPDLTISDDVTSRNGQPGSSSQNIQTGAQTYPASTSSDKTENNFKVEMALSVLDFGLAYLNASQAEDRALVALEQKRRAAQNLTMDVVRTYFQVAAAQDAIDTTEQLLVKCHNVENTFAELEKSKSLDPLRMLDERKRFIRLEKRLMAYRRSYQNSCIELRALMGYLPINEIKVDTTCLKQISVVSLPDINLLEKIALIERPELYQLDIQTNITVTEARKTILMMFPNVKAFVDFTNSSNSYLYNQSWMEIGARAAYNLLKLPQQIATYRAIDSEVDEISMRTLSLSIGVMSQVRIAHANILEVKERFELDEKVYNAYNDHLKIAKQNYKSGGALSSLELDRLELETAETQIDRALSLSNYYLAYYRLLNTIGVQSLDQKTLDRVLEEIKISEAREKAESEKHKRAIAKASQTIKENIVTFNGIALGNNTINDSQRSKLDALIPKAPEKGKRSI
ncbi:MAG: TolC family protein [Victivallaceae bacterium]